jgi:DNA polymerase III epsilon subunit-like protein
MSVPGPTVNIVILWDWVAAVRARLRQPRARRRAFDAVEFVIVDVETTGWSPEEAGITEIGAVRMSGGQIRAEFSTLVNPGQAIPPDIVALTGISDAMVTAAPPPAAALAGFLDFARGAVLTAHNAPFDISFLAAAGAGCGLPGPAGPVLDTVVLDTVVLDTVALARRLLATGGLAADDVPNCKLSTLAGYFGAPPGPQHRALADARATATVLAGLLLKFSARGVRTIAGLLAEQEYALAELREAARAEREEASGDHRDRSGEGRCGPHPGDGRDHRADPPGLRGVLGDRRVRPGGAGPGAGP